MSIPINNLTVEQAQQAMTAIKTIELVAYTLGCRVPYQLVDAGEGGSEREVTGGRVYSVVGFRNDVQIIEAALDELKVLAGLKIVVEAT